MPVFTFLLRTRRHFSTSLETTTRKFGFIRLIVITTLHALKDGVFTRFFRKFNALFMVVS